MSILGKKISTLSGTNTIASTRKFLLTDTSINETITYSDVLIQLATDLGSTNILTTEGDIITHDGATPVRLGVGTDGQYLTGSSGALGWETLPNSLNDVLTTEGDIVYRNGSEAVRLGIGTEEQVLSVSSGSPSWVSLLATRGDILTRGATTYSALPIGTNGQVLTSDGTDVSWSSVSSYSDPLTTNGDVLVRSGGATTRLGIGSNGQVLSVSGGLAAWATLPSSLTDPTSSNGEMIVRSGGALNALTVGSEGQVLSITGGIPTWSTASSSLTNLIDSGGEVIAATNTNSSFIWGNALGTETRLTANGIQIRNAGASSGSLDFYSTDDTLIVGALSKSYSGAGTESLNLTVGQGLANDGSWGFFEDGVMLYRNATLDLTFSDDAGTAAATNDGWIEITIDGATQYIRTYTTK